MTQWIMEHLGPDVPLHFTAFHPDWKMQEHPRTPLATLTRSREIARKNGLHYVYTGNVTDPAGSSTYCPGCGERVIRRERYELSDWRLVVRDGRASCGSCQAPLAGCFDRAPGNWGSRMQPVRIDR